MVDAGYFAKVIEPTPDWLNCQSVREICSVSTCVSSGAEDWVDHWRHNELGWFNSIEEFCLFGTEATATAGAQAFSVEEPEPGDYYVVEVLEADG